MKSCLPNKSARWLRRFRTSVASALLMRFDLRQHWYGVMNGRVVARLCVSTTVWEKPHRQSDSSFGRKLTCKHRHDPSSRPCASFCQNA